MFGEPEIAVGAAEPAAPSRPRAADRVSATAARLFYERGIRAVGVEEIVAQAGVTKPSLYRSFGSKDDLVAACLRARFEHVMVSLDSIAAQAPDDPLAQLRAIIAHIAREITAEEYRGCAMTNAAVEFPDEDHPVRAIARQFKAEIRARLLALASRLPVHHPDRLTDGLALLFEGARASRHTAGVEGPVRAFATTAEALIAAHMRTD